MRETRVVGVAAALAALLLLVTGCAGIPSESPVVAATQPDAPDRDISRDAREPQPGAPPEEIVQGFLDAMSEYEAGFSLAEQFLTRDARDRWDRTVIEVYDTSTAPQLTDSGIVRLSYDRVAQIDASGRYVAYPNGSPQQRPLRLERDEDGQWRIATPPDFLLISELDLGAAYGSFTTYYPDPSGEVLVPDTVWLPTEESRIAELLAETVVDGPTALLGSRGVLDLYPDGTNVDVEQSGSTVTVALSGGALPDVDERRRQLMLAQLSATLQLPGVDRVELSINDSALDLPDLSAGLDPLVRHPDPPAYLLSDTDAVLANDPDEATFTAVPGPLGRGERRARSIAVALDESQAATVDEAGREVWITPLAEGGEARLVYSGQDVAQPSFDRFGNLWLVDRLPDGLTSEIRMIPPEGGVTSVLAPDLANERVDDLRIAPDGVRVAVVTSGAGSVVRLGHVVRAQTPEIDLTVEAPLAGTTSDVVWAGATELLVVVTAADGLSRPTVVSSDGSTVSDGSVTGVTAVAAYPGRPSFALTDVSNLLRQASVLQWDQVTTARYVTYPG